MENACRDFKRFLDEVMQFVKNSIRHPCGIDVDEDDTQYKISIYSSLKDEAEQANVSYSKLQIAAQWAIELDSQFPELLNAGNTVRISIKKASKIFRTRAEFETITSYRELCLGVGDLIRPILLEQPEFKKLYPFQIEGVQWLFNTPMGILADDMGLGKTVQVIAAIRHLINCASLRSVLVVCPKGLIANWERELGNWAPELGVVVMEPSNTIRDLAWKTINKRRHIMLTNYEQLRTPPSALVNSPPCLIVADEAHRIRKMGNQVTLGIVQLNSSRFWALTGTPIERDIEDLATLLSIVVPKKFAPSDSKLHLHSLASRARRYILRRRKSDVLKDLPQVQTTTEYLQLSIDQKKAYFQSIDEHCRYGRREDELALLNRLLSLCDFEADSGQSAKIDRILYMIGNIRKRNEKAVVFSWRVEPLKLLQQRITNQWGSKASELLVGELNSQQQNKAVDRFRQNEESTVLLASSRVGGEGLTLVEANHVFFFNLWWNPSSNDQARDRVVRIGQKRKVSVYKFCCIGTVEESLEIILSKKKNLFINAIEPMAKVKNSLPEEQELLKQIVSTQGIAEIISELKK